jgi:hypothetical protein
MISINAPIRLALIFPGKKFVIIQMVYPDAELAEHDSDLMAVKEQMDWPVDSEQDSLSSAVHPEALADSIVAADDSAVHPDLAAEDVLADFLADDFAVIPAVLLAVLLAVLPAVHPDSASVPDSSADSDFLASVLAVHPAALLDLADSLSAALDFAEDDFAAVDDSAVHLDFADAVDSD